LGGRGRRDEPGEFRGIRFGSISMAAAQSSAARSASATSAAAAWRQRHHRGKNARAIAGAAAVWWHLRQRWHGGSIAKHISKA